MFESPMNWIWPWSSTFRYWNVTRSIHWVPVKTTAAVPLSEVLLELLAVPVIVLEPSKLQVGVAPDFGDGSADGSPPVQIPMESQAS